MKDIYDYLIDRLNKFAITKIISKNYKFEKDKLKGYKHNITTSGNSQYQSIEPNLPKILFFHKHHRH